LQAADVTSQFIDSIAICDPYVSPASEFGFKLINCVVCCFDFVEERNLVFFMEEKASRSTLVDVRSYAQIGIAIVLTNTDWVCLW
jgi:hypothetical protein